MRTVRKGIAVLLALVMVLSLSACSSLSAAKTVRRMQKAESFHVDCEVDMKMSLGMMGQSLVDLDFIMSGTGDVNRDPSLGAGEFRMQMMDQNVDGNYYFIQDGDELYIYSSADGENWSVNTVDVPGTSGGSGLSFSRESLAKLATITALFEKSGTETVNGSEATVYSGTISGEELQALISDSDQDEPLPDEADMSALGSIPVSISVDNKTGLISRVTFDLSALMENLFPLFLQLGSQVAAGTDDADGIDAVVALLSSMDISCDDFTLNLLFSDYDEVGEVRIPEEVIASAKAA